MEPSDQVSTGDLAKAISLRKALRDLAMSATEGHEPSAHSEDCVNAIIAAGRNADSGLGWLQSTQTTPMSVAAALAAISIQAALLLPVTSFRQPRKGTSPPRQERNHGTAKRRAGTPRTYLFGLAPKTSSSLRSRQTGGNSSIANEVEDCDVQLNAGTIFL